LTTPAEITTDGLRRLLDEHADAIQLVEVLPADDYDEEHLPGALNGALDDLDPNRPVVVYGFDLQDDRPHRAAAHLVANGRTDVRVYAGGKIAWLAEGLPAEGRRQPEQRIGAIARTEGVPIVAGGETLADAAPRFTANADVAVVLGDGDVVLGVLRRETLGLAPGTLVADALQPGPSTFRPSMTIAELVDYFRRSDARRAIVSTAAGRWIGLIDREDVLDG
jgi:rhodanese-related sulfurtransferase